MRRFSGRIVLAAAWGALGSIATAGAARADTMPQLDFHNRLLVSQVVWGAIIFAGFYFLLARWGLPKVASVLELRARTIGDDLEQARLAKAGADRAAAELLAARQKAYGESQAAIAEATRKAKAAADALAADQTSRLDKQLAESEARIAADRRDAMSRLQDIATDTAEAVIARLTGQSAERDRVHDVVGNIMSDRASAARKAA